MWAPPRSLSFSILIAFKEVKKGMMEGGRKKGREGENIPKCKALHCEQSGGLVFVYAAKGSSRIFLCG